MKNNDKGNKNRKERKNRKKHEIKRESHIIDKNKEELNILCILFEQPKIHNRTSHRTT